MLECKNLIKFEIMNKILYAALRTWLFLHLKLINYQNSFLLSKYSSKLAPEDKLQHKIAFSGCFYVFTSIPFLGV